MDPVAPQPLRPPPAGDAQVVFIRPTSSGAGVVSIIDLNGPSGVEWRGDAGGGTWLAIRMQPGTHKLSAWFWVFTGGTQTFCGGSCYSQGGMIANVAAGHTYYVLIEGGFGPTAKLRAIRPDSPERGSLAEWLAEIPRYDSIVQTRGQSEFYRALMRDTEDDPPHREEQLSKLIGEWEKHFAGYPNDQRLDQTLNVADAIDP